MGKRTRWEILSDYTIESANGVAEWPVLIRSTLPITSLFVAVLILLLSATRSAAADLIVDAIDAARIVALPQNRLGWATADNDLGEVADDLHFANLTLVLRRSAEQQRAFDELLDQQQDPASPNFHRWLTPVQVGELFGASLHDIDALISWLESQGLRVDAVANSRTRITFSGSARNVGAAFASRLHTYLVNGEQRIAPAGVPQIPAVLSAIVQSVHGLATVDERPDSRVEPAQMAGPQETSCSTNPCRHYIFPADFAAIYDLNSVYQQGVSGAGQTIAILGRARVYLPDIENFQARANLTIKDPVIVVPANGVDPGPAASTGTASSDQAEATLDVMRATSIAPGATILLVISASSPGVAGGALGIAGHHVIDNHLAQIVSISFDSCESSAGQSSVAFWDSLFSQAAAEGISVFVGSGDTGAAGCDSLTPPPPASQIPSPNAICSSSYATCVGGTEFVDVANPSAYWSSTNGAGFGSAFGYIPEGAWNDPLDSNGNPQARASGGGVSIYVPTPSWQTGLGVPGNQGRYTPDISLSASVHDGYFGCLAANSESCVTQGNGSFIFGVFSGTSASAPSMAGIAALLNQKAGSAQGNLNPSLYALAATPANGVFHDVTVSTSGVVGCDVSVPSMCNNSTPGPGGLAGGLAGYSVGLGYDLVTGLGSIDVAQLLAHWPTAPFDLNRRGLTGSWFQAITSGQGVELEIFPDLVAPGTGFLQGAWFTYDYKAAGGAASQRWYTFSGNVQTGQSSATLTLYENTGGDFNALPVTNAMPVGSATFSATDCNHTSVSYSFSDGSGRSGVIPMTRLLPNVTCVMSGAETPSADFGYSGNWYNNTTSGQGIVFELNPTQPLAWLTWYTYAPNGQAQGEAGQRWYTAQAPYAPGARTMQMTLYETAGGLFDKSAPTPTTVPVGTATATFTSCGALRLGFNFTGGSSAGASGTINMTRVGPTPTGCGP